MSYHTWHVRPIALASMQQCQNTAAAAAPQLCMRRSVLKARQTWDLAWSGTTGLAMHVCACACCLQCRFVRMRAGKVNLHLLWYADHLGSTDLALPLVGVYGPHPGLARWSGHDSVLLSMKGGQWHRHAVYPFVYCTLYKTRSSAAAKLSLLLLRCPFGPYICSSG